MGTPAPLVVCYRIDGSDRIESVNERWDEFAQANGGAATVASKVIGRSLWEFVQDRNVRQLYQHLVAAARASRPVEFPYRCDSPAERRRFRMRIAATPDRRVEFCSVLLGTETRPPVALLDAGQPRGVAAVRVCSWCLRIALGPKEWVEAEAAVDRLGLLEAPAAPALTHGICPACAEAMLRLVQAPSTPA